MAGILQRGARSLFFFFAFIVLIFTNAHYEKNEHNTFKYNSKRTKTKTKLHKRKRP